MSATVMGPISISTTTAPPGLSLTLAHFSSTAFTSRARSFPATHLFFRLPLTHSTPPSKRNPSFHGSKRLSPLMEWQDCTVKMEVDVPVSVAYTCYSDREAIPNWMPFISSVKVLPDKPDLSRWSLKYEAFGRDIEYSWLARNMQAKISNLILLLIFG